MQGSVSQGVQLRAMLLGNPAVMPSLSLFLRLSCALFHCRQQPCARTRTTARGRRSTIPTARVRPSLWSGQPARQLHLLASARANSAQPVRPVRPVQKRVMP